MIYELWDFESGNLVGRYATQDEALRAVRETVDLYGPEEAYSLLLGAEDQDRHPTTIAKGRALVNLATAPAATTVLESSPTSPGQITSLMKAGQRSPQPTAGASRYIRRDADGRFVDSRTVAKRTAASSQTVVKGKAAKPSPKSSRKRSK